MLLKRLTVPLVLIAIASASPVKAHFLWIAPDSSSKQHRVHVYFSETPEADNPELLSRLTGLQLQQNSADGKSQILTPTRGENSLVAIPEGNSSPQSYSLTHTYGLHSRDGESYLLVYHARMYVATRENRWRTPPTDQLLPLEIIPSASNGKLNVRVLWNGKPLSGAEVKVDPAGKGQIEGSSDRAGEFSVAASDLGTYAFRAKHVEKIAGERAGKKYNSVRHYSTLVVTIAGEANPKVAARPKVAGPKPSKRFSKSAKKTSTAKSKHVLPDLPFGITSFGAAIADQKIYVCGGQLGPAHEYEIEGQSDRLLRLDLRSPLRWEIIGKIPRRAGLAMVSHGGKVYRIGGFEVRNKKDEPNDLHSMPDFSRFDPATDRWTDLAPMPRGRSSHDAIVVGNRLIVVGGWELRGSEPSIWHDSALQIDLSAAHPAWEDLPQPPFHRRALTLGAHNGKLYVLGGMQEKGGPTTTSYVLDLATGKWTDGPKLPGEGLQGFGSSAITCDGQLYATTYSGKVCRLSDDGKEWQVAGQLEAPRFFHRLLCSDKGSLIAVGGGSMEEGKILSTEVMPVAVKR